MATSTTGYLQQLPLESRQFTHVAVIKAADLTDPTGASVQTIGFPIPAGCRIIDACWDLVEGFKDDSDAAFDDITASVIDNQGSPVTFITAAQVAALNSTPIRINGANLATLVSQVYATAAVMNIAFTPESGKALVNLDRGELRVYFNIQKRGQLG